MRVAHISDLHFGAASPIAVEALCASLNDKRPDLIIVTGDLTQEGRQREFQAASEFLNTLDAPVFVIPGNHDIPVRNLYARFLQPYDRFRRFVNPEINPSLRTDKLHIVGINSARRAALDINWSFGRLSRAQIRHAAAQFAAAPDDVVKALAVHHPFRKGPGRAGSRVVGRGDQMIMACAREGLDIVFTGHVHHSRAELLSVNGRSIILAQAGTATSVRTRTEPPAFNLLEISEENVAFNIYALHDREFQHQKMQYFSADPESGWKMADGSDE